MSRRRFALRTIKGGRVLINGSYYIPESTHTAYDGRLDGLRYAFGLYEGDDSFVCLWGSEAQYRDPDPEAIHDGPENVGGTLPWVWWHRETKA